MIKKYKKEEKEETPRITPKGRQEDYFFPNLRKTIKASSMKEALEKIKTKQNV